MSEKVHDRFEKLSIPNTGNDRLDWADFHSDCNQLFEDFEEIGDPPAEERIVEKLKKALRGDDRTKQIIIYNYIKANLKI